MCGLVSYTDEQEQKGSDLFLKVKSIFRVKHREKVGWRGVDSTSLCLSPWLRQHTLPGFLVDSEELACYCFVFLEYSAY